MAIGGLLAISCGGPASNSPPPAASVAPSASATASPSQTISPSVPASLSVPATPAFVDLNSAPGVLKINAPDSPDFAILADGYLFTTDVNGGMEIYDQNGKPQPPPDLSGACAAPDAGFGAVWTASCDASGGLEKVDTASFGTASIDIGGQIPTSEATIGVGEGGIWMIRGTHTATPQLKVELIEVNPQVQVRKVVFSEQAPAGATAVRVGFGSVWVSSPTTDTITRIDPTTGAIQATIKVGRQPTFFVAGEGAVWTLDQQGRSVSRIDPATNTVTATIDLGEIVEGGDIAVGGGYVWARSSATLLFQIDAVTNQIVARYGPPSGSGSVAADDNYAWITAHDINTIWRVALH